MTVLQRFNRVDFTVHTEICFSALNTGVFLFLSCPLKILLKMVASC